MKLAVDAMTAEEIRALPAMVDGWPTAAAALGGMSRNNWYALVASGETPVPIVRIGRLIKVRRADLMAVCGLEDDAPHGYETEPAKPDRNGPTSSKPRKNLEDDDAGAVTPASDERTSTSTSK